jgi:Type VI secretion system/phage-baseplate injector OB domain
MSDLPTLGSLKYRESIVGGAGEADDFESTGPKKRFFGIYAGTVVSNIDLEARGRLIVLVPQVLGEFPSNWAMPCFPVAGKQMAISALPIIGDAVWVAFEDGDPGRPIWLGCFWGSVAESPPTQIASPPITPNIVLQSIGQNSITIMGTPGGGIMLSAGPTVSPGPKILITAAGIVITDGLGTGITIAGGTIVMSAPGAPLALVVK